MKPAEDVDDPAGWAELWTNNAGPRPEETKWVHQEEGHNIRQISRLQLKDTLFFKKQFSDELREKMTLTGPVGNIWHV